MALPGTSCTNVGFLVTRLPLARSLVVALLGVSLVLAVIAVLAVSSLYESRQVYENELARSYSTEVAVANLLAAGVVEEAVLRTGGDTSARQRVAASYGLAAAAARAAVRGDAASAELIETQVSAQGRARAATGDTRDQELRSSRQIATGVAERQRERRVAARAEARGSSRRATITAAAAGGLALLAALGLAAALIGSVRRPLDALVSATRFVARGDTEVQVREEGPAELRQLAGSFNTMAGGLAEARAQVESERRRLAAVVESLGDALVMAGGDGRVVQVNPRAADLVPELGIGGNTQASGSPLPRLTDALSHEVQIEHRERTLAVTAARLGEKEADGVVWTIRDISDRARLERAKSEFVATASHELRSPLTSIKGFAELLLRSEGLGERQREFAETVVLSTNRLVDLVNDLLDVTRIEAGHMELLRRPTEIGEVVEEVVHLMRPRIEAKRQTIKLEMPANTPPAMADPARIRQIVNNLVTNAHLYTPEGGNITVRVGVDGGMVALMISDDGPGLNRRQLAHLFDRFYRGEADDGIKQPGTGLGLSIVKSLVDMHHGSIEVDSELGGGATFTVKVPRAPAAADLPAPWQALHGKRVLVVEDQPEIAELIVEQLTPHQVQTTVVPSGEEALRVLAEQHFDAVTLDILLTGITGFEVLQAMRADPALRRIPVVVVSVLSGKEALAGEWVVSKPIDAEELVDALGSAILAGRSRVLVVGRATVRGRLGPSLTRLGIDHDWATNGAEAARLCEERRFEVALIDSGLRSPQAVLEKLDLRGRRLQRSVVVFSTGDDAPGLAKLDAQTVSLEDATTAVLAALASSAEETGDGPEDG